MTPALAKSLDNERFLTRLMFLLKHPTKEMIEAGRDEIKASCVVEYQSCRAPIFVLDAMVEIALKEAGNG